MKYWTFSTHVRLFAGGTCDRALRCVACIALATGALCIAAGPAAADVIGLTNYNGTQTGTGGGNNDPSSVDDDSFL